MDWFIRRASRIRSSCLRNIASATLKLFFTWPRTLVLRLQLMQFLRDFISRYTNQLEIEFGRNNSYVQYFQAMKVLLEERQEVVLAALRGNNFMCPFCPDHHINPEESVISHALHVWKRAHHEVEGSGFNRFLTWVSDVRERVCQDWLLIW